MPEVTAFIVSELLRLNQHGGGGENYIFAVNVPLNARYLYLALINNHHEKNADFYKTKL